MKIDFPNGEKLVICKFYRVDTLGVDNFNKVEKYLQAVRKRKGITNFILAGDLNISNIDWNHPESCSNELDHSFLKILAYF